MKKILVIAECLNKNQTSEGVSTSNFLNAIVADFDVTCVYFQMLQHEMEEHPSWIDPAIRLVKIQNTRADKLLYKARRLRDYAALWGGLNLLRSRRSQRFMEFLTNDIDLTAFDLVFVRTVGNSIASHQAMLKLSRRMSIPWVAYFNDPVPNSFMPYPYSIGSEKFRKAENATERLVKNIIASCDVLASPSEMLNLRLKVLTGNTQKKHVNFPHILNTTAKASSDEKVFSYIKKDKINIVHAGSLLKERNPFAFLSALEEYFDAHPSVRESMHVTFFGSIHAVHKPVFEKFKWKENLSLFNQRIPHDLNLAILSNADLLVIIEADVQDSPFLPTKFAEFVGLKKSLLILSPAGGEVRRLLGGDYPLQASPASEHEIYQALSSFDKSIKASHELKVPEFLMSYFSSNFNVSQLKKIFNQLA